MQWLAEASQKSTCPVLTVPEDEVTEAVSVTTVPEATLPAGAAASVVAVASLPCAPAATGKNSPASATNRAERMEPRKEQEGRAEQIEQRAARMEYFSEVIGAFQDDRLQFSSPAGRAFDRLRQSSRKMFFGRDNAHSIPFPFRESRQLRTEGHGRSFWTRLRPPRGHRLSILQNQKLTKTTIMPIYRSEELWCLPFKFASHFG